MTEPQWLSVARRYLGEHEIAGQADNKTIVSFFRRTTGRPDKDETPWCAAFVGNCLAEAGLPTTGKLNARSYLAYGEAITEPRPGAIAVFQRGNSSWQGHVAFVVADEGGALKVLGGNQGDAVSVARYSKAKLLGYRWPAGAAAPEPAKASSDLEAVQRRLIDLGYSEVGAVDGKWGTRTRTALLGFKADNGLPLTEDVDQATLTALMTAKPRQSALERSTATVDDLREKGSQTIKQGDNLEAAGKVAVGTGAAVGAAEKTGLLDQILNYLPYLNSLKSVGSLLLDYWWVGAIVLGIVAWRAGWLIKIRRWYDHVSGAHTGR